MSQPQGVFATDQAWQAIADLLTSQLEDVDCAVISDKDFNENGEIVMQPPSVRVFFAGEIAKATSDSQRLSYEVDGRYAVMVADIDYSSAANQAMASAALLAQVKSILAGARIVLSGGDVSEPVQWVSTEPQPVEGVGMAYCLGFIVPGLAQFPGTNARPQGGN